MVSYRCVTCLWEMRIFHPIDKHHPVIIWAIWNSDIPCFVSMNGVFSSHLCCCVDNNNGQNIHMHFQGWIGSIIVGNKPKS